MTEKTLTTENIRPALDALRGELAPWPVVAKKQDRLNTAQLNAANSGITSSLVAQIIANTAAIRALESAITGTGLRPLVVASLPATGTQGILYIVPVTTYDPETDADVVNYSNEYIWIVAPDAPVTEGYYEQVGQTGIVINNGQLNITVNGTSVGTFTANQSGDTTAAITVPTNADYVDRTTAQTIAGTKTFSSTIDGTASKAIADEDGTSIKTGYVNVAGNQTVTGQKTWSGNQFFTAGIYRKNTSYEIGNTPASNVVIPIYFVDKNNANTGYVRNVILATGKTQSELMARNKVTSGALSPTGTDVTSSLQVEVQSNGDKTLYFDGSIRNNALPYTTNTYALGSSSYQWSSVYAQSYYYNGTAWGLDQANVWTGNNTFKSANSNFGLQSTTAEAGSTTASSNWMYWLDKNGYQDAYISRDFWNDGGDTLRISISGKRANGAPSTSGTAVECGIRLDITANGSKSVSPFVSGDTDLGTSTNQWKSVYSQTYFYNGVAWGLDKTNEWSSTNRFLTSIALKNTGLEKGVMPSSNNWRIIDFTDKNNNALSTITARTNTTGESYIALRAENLYKNGVMDSTGSLAYSTLYIGLTSDGKSYCVPRADVYPEYDNYYNLGTSTNKWKTLNGVNPGALSLPDVSNAISLDTTNVRMDGTYTYLPVSVNGWLNITLNDTTCKTDGELTFYIGDSGAVSNAKWAVNFVCSTDGYVRCFIPVLANNRIRIRINPNGGSPTGLTMTVYPCLGNV